MKHFMQPEHFAEESFPSTAIMLLTQEEQND